MSSLLPVYWPSDDLLILISFWYLEWESWSREIFLFIAHSGTEKVKLNSLPLCCTCVKFLRSLSLPDHAGRHSTAPWTRAPHLKVAYPAPTITLSWGCTIPKMTSHSEKQVMFPLIFCVTYCLCCDTWSLHFQKKKKKKRVCCQKAVFHGAIYLRSAHTTPLSSPPSSCHWASSVRGRLWLCSLAELHVEGSFVVCQSLWDVFTKSKLIQRSACLKSKYVLLSEKSTKKSSFLLGFAFYIQVYTLNK